MAPKFQNLVQTQLFGNFTDPYVQRTGTGSVRPSQPLPYAQPDFKKSFPEKELHFAWLGHSSVMLAAGGKRILIDPVFSQYVSPLPFAGPKRFPGRSLTAKDFPEIDLVLITHSHYDHLDKKTIQLLDSLVKHYVVPFGIGSILRRFGIDNRKITELDWFAEWRGTGIQVILTPSQHGSARSPFDQNRTLWGSFVIKTNGFTIFDTGDGGFGEHFLSIAQRYGSPDLAIMECGQYNVRWHGVHMFPEESAQAAMMLGAKLAIPVHWGAYVLSDHPWDDPPKRFAQHADEIGLQYRIPILYQWLTIQKEGNNYADNSD